MEKTYYIKADVIVNGIKKAGCSLSFRLDEFSNYIPIYSVNTFDYSPAEIKITLVNSKGKVIRNLATYNDKHHISAKEIDAIWDFAVIGSKTSAINIKDAEEKWNNIKNF
jgi:hypothetical protein